MMRRHFLPKLGCISIALILTACVQTPPPQARHIDIASHVVGVNHAIQINTIRAIYPIEGLKIQVEARNHEGERNVLYYRIRWLDRNGMMMGQYQPWQSESFDGGQTSVISAQAPSNQTADFKLEIKPDY
jgi:hypothetical protein